MAVVDQLNSLPTTNTGIITPLQAFTGRKPLVPAFAFGTIGVVYHPRQDDKTLRGEIGIFLSHGYHRRYIKGFIPTRDKTYSVRQLTPLREQVTPLSWKFQQNTRSMTIIPTGKGIEGTNPELIESDTLEVTNPQPSTKSTSNDPSTVTPITYRDQVPNQTTDSFGPPHESTRSRANPSATSEKQYPFSAPDQETLSPADPRFDQEGEIIDHHTHAQLPNRSQDPKNKSMIKTMVDVYPHPEMSNTLNKSNPSQKFSTNQQMNVDPQNRAQPSQRATLNENYYESGTLNHHRAHAIHPSQTHPPDNHRNPTQSYEDSTLPTTRYGRPIKPVQRYLMSAFSDYVR
jgi:hypothetical protein